MQKFFTIKIRESKKSAFTLIEILISISLFAIVATISSQIIFRIIDIQQKVSVQSVFYEDAKLILQQIAKEVQNGAIDYEEYYSHYVIQVGKGYFGLNYGAYTSRFYDPGKRLDGEASINPLNLGLECSYPDPAPAKIEDCEIFYNLSIDYNTGYNPFKGAGLDYHNSNAFCDDPNNSTCISNASLGYTDKLFLLDSSGTKKTIIARKKTSALDSYALAKVEMDGLDVDQNGVIDTWRCKDEYTCFGRKTEEDENVALLIKHPYINSADDVKTYDITLPSVKDLGNVYGIDETDFHHFVPITPLRANIENLTFIIHPLEDPFKAFGETDFQSQPSVTIVLTMGLNPDFASKYPGDFPSITVQTTVTAGILSKINSYPPTNDVSWIDDLTNVPDVK